MWPSVIVENDEFVQLQMSSQRRGLRTYTFLSPDRYGALTSWGQGPLAGPFGSPTRRPNVGELFWERQLNFRHLYSYMYIIYMYICEQSYYI